MNDADNYSVGNYSPTEDGQWVEMAWAARNAVLPSLNGARRAWFEGVKALLRATEPPRTSARKITLIGNKAQ